MVDACGACPLLRCRQRWRWRASASAVPATLALAGVCYGGAGEACAVAERKPAVVPVLAGGRIGASRSASAAVFAQVQAVSRFAQRLNGHARTHKAELLPQK